MFVVVDAYIVFSAMLNTQSRIGQLLLNGPDSITFIAPDFLLTELHRHHAKICRITRMTSDETVVVRHIVCSAIRFVSEELISPQVLQEAEMLVADTDPKDAIYVALAMQFDCPIWSGDQKLRQGLRPKGFHSFISMDDLAGM